MSDEEVKLFLEKWDDQVAMWRRVMADALFYTKEERIKAANYASSICAVIADFKKRMNITE